MSADSRGRKQRSICPCTALEDLNERIIWCWTDIEERLKRAAKAFAQIGTPTKSIVGSKELVLFEGLPHQRWEKDLLEEELKTKRTVQLHDFPFYQEKLAMAEEDADVVRRILADVKSVEAWVGAKFCGGYHPDYLLEWRTGRRGVPHRFVSAVTNSSSLERTWKSTATFTKMLLRSWLPS